jgi:hypothetical protein
MMKTNMAYNMSEGASVHEYSLEHPRIVAKKQSAILKPYFIQIPIARRKYFS